MINVGSFTTAKDAVCRYIDREKIAVSKQRSLTPGLITDALCEYAHENPGSAELESVLAQYPRLLDCSCARDESRSLSIIEHAVNHRQRKAGAFYTPPQIIMHILHHVLQDKCVSLCDPACGTGLFLTQGAKQMAAIRCVETGEPYAQALKWTLCHSIFGADIDKGAVVLARCALASLVDFDVDVESALKRHIIRADALLRKWPRKFGCVVGNPPYIDSESMLRHQPDVRNAICQLYQSAKGNWDIYIPFIELAMRITEDGGRFGLLTPTDLMYARYAKSLQDLMLSQSNPIVYLDYTEAHPFSSARVKVSSLICQKEPCHVDARLRRIKYGRKYKLISDETSSLSRIEHLPAAQLGAIWDISDESLQLKLLPAKLGDYLQFSDGASTEEAYHIAEWMRDEDMGQDGLKLVNTGTIDPFKMRWGDREMVYLKRHWLHPMVPKSILSANLPRRYTQAMSPKILIAGLSRHIEAVAVPSGVLCGKSAVQGICIADVCLDAVAAYLNSTLVRDYVFQVYQSGTFTALGTHMTARIAENIPAPPLPMLSRDSLLSKLGSQARTTGVSAELQLLIDEAVLDAVGMSRS